MAFLKPLAVALAIGSMTLSPVAIAASAQPAAQPAKVEVTAPVAKAVPSQTRLRAATALKKRERDGTTTAIVGGVLFVAGMCALLCDGDGSGSP